MITSSYKVIALMSGTSLDGLDMVYVTIYFDTTWHFEIHHSDTIQYSDEWAQILRQLSDRSRSDLTSIDFNYSKFLGNRIKDFIIQHKISKLDFITSHGHTALHRPHEGITYQIGNHQIISDTCLKKVICDFRVQDVSYGGQGAPLVPIGDRLLFHDYEYCLNLGGFANISYEENEQRIAFDICPVNIVLNYYTSKLGKAYDDEGKIAAGGVVHNRLLNQLNALDYFFEKPPKSLGIEWVKQHIFPLIATFELTIPDILRTFVEHAAYQISKILSKNDAQVLVTGGGVYNDFLIARIRELAVTTVKIPSAKIIEYKEALIFGLLGVLRERNEINCLKSVTGASIDHSSGEILIPNSKINM